MENASDAELLRHQAAINEEVRRRGLQKPQPSTASASSSASSSRASTVIFTPNGSEREDASVSDMMNFTPDNSDTESVPGAEPPHSSVGSMVSKEVQQYTTNHGIFIGWVNPAAFHVMPLPYYQETGNLHGLVARCRAIAAKRPQSIPANVILALDQNVTTRKFVSDQYLALRALPGSVLDEGNKQHKAIQNILRRCLKILTKAQLGRQT